MSSWIVPVAWLLAATAFVGGRWLVVRGLGMRHVADVLVPPVDRWTRASRARRVALVAAGPAACWIVAGLILSAAFAIHGAGGHASSRVDVAPGGAAATAGLVDGDRIVAIDGTPIEDFAGIRSAMAARQRDGVELEVERDGSVRAFTVPLGTGKLGIIARVESRQLTVGASVARGFAQPVRTVTSIAEHLVAPEPAVQLTGPVAIARALSAAEPEPGAELFALGALVSNVLVYALVIALGLALLPTRGRRSAG